MNIDLLNSIHNSHILIHLWQKEQEEEQRRSDLKGVLGVTVTVADDLTDGFFAGEVPSITSASLVVLP